MTDKNIEKYLAQAVEQNTPDILDELLAELPVSEAPQKSLGEQLMEEDFVSAKPARSSRRSLRPLLSIAAVLILVVGGISVFRNANSAFAVIGMDVNPSIEFTISNSEKVLDAKAVNDEGKEILNDLKLKGTDINTACYAVTGAMLTRGYLSDTSNSILMSVQSKDPDKGKAMEQKLSEDLNSYLTDSSIAPAIVAQYVDEDEELAAFAEANNISVGKAQLIRRILDTGSTKMTEKDLLGLSTQELILLAQNRQAKSEATYGSANTSMYIGEEAAVAAALKEAGIEKSAASNVHTGFDCEDGRIIYEVEFNSDGIEYEYDIDALTGSVVTSDSERADSNSSGTDYDDDDDDQDDIDDRDDDDDDRYDDRDDADDRYESDDDDKDDDRYNDHDDDDDDRDDHDDDNDRDDDDDD